MSQEIPSHVKPCLEALRKELNEINSWIIESEEHINQYKIIAEQKTKAIKELEDKYNL